MSATRRWSDCLDVLAAYYGIPKVVVRVNPGEVPPSAIACYFSQQTGREPMIYTKEGRIAPETAFHEFAHHLASVALKGRLTSTASEHFADAYAKEVANIWESL